VPPAPVSSGRSRDAPRRAEWPDRSHCPLSGRSQRRAPGLTVHGARESARRVVRVHGARFVRGARFAVVRGVPVAQVSRWHPVVRDCRRRWDVPSWFRPRFRLASSLPLPRRRRRGRGLVRRQARWRYLWADVGHGRDEGDVDVQSCIVRVKGGSVLQITRSRSRGIQCPAVIVAATPWT
jgi:hypothetical protein